MSLADTLAWLIDIPSVTGDEAALTAAVAGRLGERVPVAAVARSIVAGEPGARPLVVLYGHTDTVPVQGNLPHRMSDDRIHGLGASDMKAGLAVMVHLMEARAGDYDLAAVFYDGEEGPAAGNGLEGVLDAVPWLGDAVLSVILEPTDLRVEMGCNGVLNADVVFTGHAAHSARPWLGENAITKAGRWLAEMHERLPQSFEVGGLEFREVFSVTTASGGIAHNVIPAAFTVNLNHRFPPVFDLAEAEDRLRSVTTAADRVVIRDRAPAAGVAADNDHVRRLVAAAGGDVGPKQGWTDVARLTARGIPALNYGPGEVAQAHQRTESVPIANLDRAYDVLAGFLGAGG